MELLGLQKPHLEPLLQKSQYGLAFGKPSNLNHGFFGNLAFSPGISYLGSPIRDPVIPNLPFESISPVMHGEQITHFSSGLRNIPGSFMECNLEESFASSLLYEFKSNKTKFFELREIAGHVAEFMYIIQEMTFDFILLTFKNLQKFILKLFFAVWSGMEIGLSNNNLKTGSAQEKNMVFHEIMPHRLSLMTDVFGNYVIQKVWNLRLSYLIFHSYFEIFMCCKVSVYINRHDMRVHHIFRFLFFFQFFEHGSASQIRQLTEHLTGYVLNVSLQMC